MLNEDEYAAKDDDQKDLSAEDDDATMAITDPHVKMEHVANMQASKFQVLADVCVHIYDESLREEATWLCNLMGAIVIDEIVPYMTTHIIALKHTPILKHHLSTMESQVQDSMNRSGFVLNERK